MLAVRPSRLRCAYCRDDLGPTVLSCVACRTLIHEECELDACPTLGCGSLVPWELVLPAREEPIPLVHMAALFLLPGIVALLVGLGTHAGLVAVWPQRLADEETLAPPVTRPGPGPDPDVPALDPWFWWAPGTEIVVRTRLRQVRESRWYACGRGRGASGTSWDIDTQESEHTFRLEETTAYEVVIASSGSCRSRRPLDVQVPTELEDVLEDRPGAPLILPIGTFAARYRRAHICPWELDVSWSSPIPMDGVEETWSDPRIPIPLRRLVTWHVDEAPPGYRTGSLETTIIAIRGQAAIR